jgi:hypothetical protein
MTKYTTAAVIRKVRTSLRMLPHKIGPVRIAEKSGAPTSEGDEWCNEVLHDRIHHGSDGHPHDHGHRQVNHITAQDEML